MTIRRRTPQHRTRQRSRTIPISGESGIGFGQDDDKWFECWHCGFPCNEDRESLGGSGQFNEVGSESSQESAIPTTGDELSAMIVPGGVTQTAVALETGADGTARQVNNAVIPLVSQGCPFCGSLNWRGDY